MTFSRELLNQLKNQQLSFDIEKDTEFINSLGRLSNT